MGWALFFYLKKQVTVVRVVNIARVVDDYVQPKKLTYNFSFSFDCFSGVCFHFFPYLLLPSIPEA